VTTPAKRRNAGNAIPPFFKFLTGKENKQSGSCKTYKSIDKEMYYTDHNNLLG
jgi:hypothetical protein